MTAPRPARNPFWGLVVLSAAGFCIGVLAYVSAGLGDRTHPLNQFFNRHGAAVTIGLAIATVLSGGLALRVDRVQTLRQSSKQNERSEE
ncbi:MAG: hypothetical protein JNG89_08135 [Planctomycetaceae bacterium]|nr:hypothetical protein [Planctomycetaceae bacterium]